MPAARDPIGVLDSGLGGLSVLKALREELPNEQFLYCADCAHTPWGDKPESFIVERTRAIVHFLLRKQAKAVVLACNTATAAAAGDQHLQQLLRYDVNISNAIVSVARERNITDIVMGMHQRNPAMTAIPAIPGIPGTSGPGIGRMVTDVLTHSNITTFIYSPAQPITTIKRHLIVIPEQAEKEAGFQAWVRRIRLLAENSGAKVVLFAAESHYHHVYGQLGGCQPLQDEVQRRNAGGVIVGALAGAVEVGAYYHLLVGALLRLQRHLHGVAVGMRFPAGIGQNFGVCRSAALFNSLVKLIGKVFRRRFFLLGAAAHGVVFQKVA